MAKFENFQVPISFEECAKIAHSKGLLGKEQARRIILNSLMNNDETLLKTIYSEVSRDCPQMILPEKLKKSLIYVIETMATRIFKWIKEQKYKYGEWETPSLKAYADHVRFTNNGFIDTSESLRSMHEKSNFPDNYKTWEILCDHCLEDSIKEFYENPELSEIVSREMKNHINIIEREDILRLYWFDKTDINANVSLQIHTALSEELDTVHHREEIDVKMFILSIADCNYAAVQYFWKLLNNDQKMHVIAQLKFSVDYAPLASKCKETKIGEHQDIILLAIFLLHILSYYEIKNEFIMLLQTSDIMKKLLYWPWQNTFVRTMKDSEYYDTVEYYFSLIIEMSEFTCQENANSNCLTHSEIFLETWKKVGNFKGSIDWIRLIAPLLRRKNIVLLKFFINNENLREKRSRFLEMIFAYFCNISLAADFIPRFIEDVLIFEEEKKKFIAAFPPKCDENQ